MLIDWGRLRMWSVERFVVSTTVKTSTGKFSLTNCRRHRLSSSSGSLNRIAPPSKHTGGDTLSLCLLEPPFHQLMSISAILISRCDGSSTSV